MKTCGDVVPATSLSGGRPRHGPIGTGAARVARGPAPVDALPSPSASDTSHSATAVDPAQILPVADVVLDQLPQWPRNPFENPRRAVQPVVMDETPVAAPPPEPEVVVATILYSPERRLAMVNGRIAAVGDKVGSATIVEIQPKAIVIDSPTQGRRTIPLRPSLGVRGNQ